MHKEDLKDDNFMRKYLKKLVSSQSKLVRISTFINCVIVASFLLNACSISPNSIITKPTSARPEVSQIQPAKNGSIFLASAYRPMFEDRRPRFVGDILTINIVENTTAAKTGANKTSKAGSVKSSITSAFGSPVPRATFQAASDTSFDDKANSDASNKFSGTVGVTVIEVLANGNLVVSGEKQIAFDKGTEFVRFSGVVNPDNVTQGNVVSSNRVADARIEYRSNTQIDAAQIVSILSRFFFSFIPL